MNPSEKPLTQSAPTEPPPRVYNTHKLGAKTLARMAKAKAAA